MLTLFCRHSAHIKHLEAENLWLKMQMVHERQRAERAVDTLLALKIGVPPITVPTREERMDEAAIIAAMEQEPDFAKTGVVE